ncbi:hypothetical protein PTTG_01556 [Puccinia triticina 1-1 BBBD Race 1]|uniref:Uncharacterized protein n=1 Tax=Puccinia triticina (isolate 1-1 / race 1 (BBBD)) TaxID=630390 RepID=A0A180H731_PUCT1|nr:hypothetical protein PTTG_01556 [Puccinia triticina 1-1 BBBD Race 1]
MHQKKYLGPINWTANDYEERIRRLEEAVHILLAGREPSQLLFGLPSRSQLVSDASLAEITGSTAKKITSPIPTRFSGIAVKFTLSAAIHSIRQLALPNSLKLIQSQISHLRAYSRSSPAHALHLAVVFSLLFVFKEVFSVPGTALLKILIGAI